MSPRTVALLLVSVALLAPTVAAQDPVVGSDIAVEMPDLPEIPPGGSRTKPVNVTYQWDAGAVSPDDTQVEITVEVDHGPLEAWTQVSVSPQMLTFSPDGQQGSQTKQTNLTVSPGDEAPAMVPAAVTVTANASQNGAIQPAEDNGTVRAFAEPVYDVLAEPQQSVQMSDGRGTVEVAVSNEGNGPVSVAIGNVSAPEGITATPGEAVLLGPGGDVQANADAFDVSEAVRDQLAADPSGTLLLELEGSGSGRLVFDVAYGPSGNGTTAAGSSGAQVQVQDGGLPLVPLLIVLLVAAAVGGGYYLFRERDEERAGEPVLRPLDSSEVEGANEGETWLEVESDEEE